MVENNSSDDIMFSVEVMTYNQKDYIAQTLQSIIDQKHNYKYEILVGDDCSTDGTQDIIKEFQAKYPDIVKLVFNEKNLGAMPNYYKTIARAKGKYIMGCAGDDYWLPGKVEKQISFMERNLDFDVCYGMANVCNENGNFTGLVLGQGYDDYKNLLFKGNNIPALTHCIRKSFFDQYLKDIQPQNKAWRMEDYPYLLYAAFEHKNFFCIRDSLAVYRIVEGSLSHQADIKKSFLFEKSTYEIRKFFADKYGQKIAAFDSGAVLKTIYERERSKNNSTRLKRNYKMIKKEFCITNKVNVTAYLKKFVKAFIPYGIIVFCRKIKHQ